MFSETYLEKGGVETDDVSLAFFGRFNFVFTFISWFVLKFVVIPDW